ncbi:MAG TPA: hypothetical protein VFP11_00975 [Candidatus Angelobacter sp.]|nr:hypothetical protein [Candidatus Angelobacter sp.]
MTATLLYRISAFVLVLFAAGHTLGFMTFKAPTPEGVAVQQSMDNVRFSLGGKSLSYGDFYRGFGLFCTAYLLFNAFLAWHLGTMARNTPQAIGALGWVFFALQVVGIALSWRYFVLPPTIFSAVLAIMTGWAAWLVNGAKA